VDIPPLAFQLPLIEENLMWCPCLSDAIQQWSAWLAHAAAERRKLTRRQALKAATAALAAAGCAPAATGPQKAQAESLLSGNVSVDLHSHPGLHSRISPTSLGTHLDRIARGRLKVVFLTAVGDGAVLRSFPTGRVEQYREPDPGELYTFTYRQLSTFRGPIDKGQVILVRNAGDLERLTTAATPGGLLAVEGGDFLEGRLGRVKEAYDRGIRSIQLTHYRINELGDIQTRPAVHGGLTSFGKDVIREMNRLGMVVDVAHATFAGVKSAVDVAQKPMILSHTILFTRTQMARAITREHGQLVARQGGVIGVFPVATDAFNFNGFIDHVSRLVDAVGVDHVGIGTDMDGIPGGPVFSDYAEWPNIPAALLARGYRSEDVVKVMGGNFVRVLRVVAPA
jgi:membrane dipeptidase